MNKNERLYSTIFTTVLISSKWFSLLLTFSVESHCALLFHWGPQWPNVTPCCMEAERELLSLPLLTALPANSTAYYPALLHESLWMHLWSLTLSVSSPQGLAMGGKLWGQIICCPSHLLSSGASKLLPSAKTHSCKSTTPENNTTTYLWFIGEINKV